VKFKKALCWIKHRYAYHCCPKVLYEDLSFFGTSFYDAHLECVRCGKQKWKTLSGTGLAISYVLFVPEQKQRKNCGEIAK